MGELREPPAQELQTLPAKGEVRLSRSLNGGEKKIKARARAAIPQQNVQPGAIRASAVEK
jgi:hypothetical protein